MYESNISYLVLLGEPDSLRRWNVHGNFLYKPRNEMIATSDSNHKIKIRPFMGIMGMPPDEPGLHSTIPPRYGGGNIGRVTANDI